MHWKKSASLINSAVVQLESRSFQLGFLWFSIFFTSFGMDLRKLKFCGKKISGDFCVRDCEDTA
nr:MAG TPA: hypothetical protein [Caudoviricetes sp.]